MFDIFSLLLVCIVLFCTGVIGSLVSFAFGNAYLALGFLMLIPASTIIYMKYLYVG